MFLLVAGLKWSETTSSLPLESEDLSTASDVPFSVIFHIAYLQDFHLRQAQDYAKLMFWLIVQSVKLLKFKMSIFLFRIAFIFYPPVFANTGEKSLFLHN